MQLRAGETTTGLSPALPTSARRSDVSNVDRDRDRLISEPPRAAPRVTARSIQRTRDAASNVALDTDSLVVAAGPAPHSADLGERFLTELGHHRAQRTQPLPAQFQPLATTIVGDRPVRVASDERSRLALRSVDKVAATTGDTIHLDRPVTAVSAEVLAHELTHVAHPSAAPRFYADDRHSAEERRAEQVAAVMRRSPILPRTTAAAETMRTTTVAPALARVGSGTAATIPTNAAHATVSATALAAQITGNTSGGVVQRWTKGSGPRSLSLGSHRAAASIAPSQPAVAPPVPAPEPEQPPGYETSAQESSPVEQRSNTTALANFDQILELLEERIIGELERRGGRFRGGF